MKKLRTFFYSMRRSLFDPSYYGQVLKTPLSFSLKFFFMFCLIFGLISTISINAYLIPEVNKFASIIQSKAYQIYPEELEINITDNKLSINQAMPYFIPINFKELFSDEFPDTAITNLVVIDTKSDTPAKDIRQYQTMALLTEDSLAIRSERNEIRVFSLQEMQIDNFKLDYPLYKETLDKFLPYLKYLSSFMAGLIAVFFIIFFPLSKLWHLALFSLLAMLVSKLMKPKLGYKQAFQIGLHAFALPTLFIEIIKLFTPRLPIPFFYSLIFLVFFLLILAKLEKK